MKEEKNRRVRMARVVGGKGETESKGEKEEGKK